MFSTMTAEALKKFIAKNEWQQREARKQGLSLIYRSCVRDGQEAKAALERLEALEAGRVS